MAAQNVLARIDGASLHFSWDLVNECHAISIQVAQDVDFSRQANHFVVPVVPGATLELGRGAWYFRIGTWIGKKEVGKIVWTPVYGPANILAPRAPIEPPVNPLRIVHHHPIVDGVRIHTGDTDVRYGVFEAAVDRRFPMGSTKWTYVKNPGHGYFDATGLNTLEVWNVRVSVMGPMLPAIPRPPRNEEGGGAGAGAGAAASVPLFPRAPEPPTKPVEHLCAGRVVAGIRPLRPRRHADSTLTTGAHAGTTLLREMQERGAVRFPSHAVYVRYLHAKTTAGLI
jgi:hypothetical protein